MPQNAPGADTHPDARPALKETAPTTASIRIEDSATARQNGGSSTREHERYVRQCDRALRLALRELPPCREVEQLMDRVVPARVALRRRKARAALAEVCGGAR